MPPKGKAKLFHFPIESQKQWEQTFHTEDQEGMQPLHVIDVHMDWCGPC